MTKDQKKAVLANFVAGLSAETIAKAMGLLIAEVQSALVARAAEPINAAPVLASARAELRRKANALRIAGEKSHAEIAAALGISIVDLRALFAPAGPALPGGVRMNGPDCLIIEARSRRI